MAANSLSASYTRSDGYQRSKAGSLNSDYSGGKAFYQGSFTADNFNLNWHAGLSTKGFGSNTFYGAKWDEQFEHTFKSYTAVQAETTHGKLHLRPAVYWNHQEDRFELFRESPDKYPFNYHRTDILGLNLNSWFDWALGRTAVGAEMRNEDLLSGNERILFPMCKQRIDRDAEAYKHRVEVNRANGANCGHGKGKQMGSFASEKSEDKDKDKDKDKELSTKNLVPNTKE